MHVNIKENGRFIIWKVVNILIHILTEIFPYCKALKVKISVHSNFPYRFTHSAPACLNVKSIWEYFLPKSNLHPVLGSHRCPLDLQRFQNKLTTARFLMKNQMNHPVDRYIQMVFKELFKRRHGFAFNIKNLILSELTAECRSCCLAWVCPGRAGSSWRRDTPRGWRGCWGSSASTAAPCPSSF